MSGLLEDAVIACWVNHGFDDFFLSKRRNIRRRLGCYLESSDVVKLEIADLGVLRNRIICNS